MTVSDEDRQKMDRLARDLAATENDEEVAGEVLESMVARENLRRSAAGLPLMELDEDPPELELYRRARALGMR